MAISARRAISPNSLRRRVAESADLAMAPPARLIASDGKQILGNHTPAHVALKSRRSFVGGSPHRKRMLQGADGSFTAGPPAQGSPEPALLLLLGPLGREASARRQRHFLHSKLLRLPFVFGGKKTSVGGSHLRRSSEARLLLLEGRHPGGGIVRVAGQNLVTAHDAVFHLVNPHQPTKLVGLVRFPFANDFAMRFEQTQHFAFQVTVSTPHSFLGLRNHLLDQREKVPQLADLCFYPQELAHYFQPSLPPSLHHFAGLSHHAAGQRSEERRV